MRIVASRYFKRLIVFGFSLLIASCGQTPVKPIPDEPKTREELIKDGTIIPAAGDSSSTLAKFSDGNGSNSEQKAKARAKLLKKIDEITGVTYYYDRTTPKYNQSNNISLYIASQGNSDQVRLRIRFTAEDWLFIESYIIKADDQKFTITPLSIERDNSGGQVWEWSDEQAIREDLEMAKVIANSKKAVIRYNGQQYYKDRTITAAEKSALKHILEAIN